MLELTERIATRAPLVIEEYRTRLNERIEQLLQTTEVDRTRLATEVALFADRASKLYGYAATSRRSGCCWTIRTPLAGSWISWYRN